MSKNALSQVVPWQSDHSSLIQRDFPAEIKLQPAAAARHLEPNLVSKSLKHGVIKIAGCLTAN
jgi:hypothetical protein